MKIKKSFNYISNWQTRMNTICDPGPMAAETLLLVVVGERIIGSMVGLEIRELRMMSH